MISKTILDSLKDLKERLKRMKEEMETRITCEEKRHRQRTDRVRDWLNRVEWMQQNVDEIINEDEEEIQKKRLRSLVPNNFCSYDIK